MNFSHQTPTQGRSGLVSGGDGGEEMLTKQSLETGEKHQRRVLISLVGGRPLPNILLAVHLRPDDFYFVVSRDSDGEGRDFDKTIQALPPNIRPKWKVVNPYDLTETVAVCRQWLSLHRNDEIILNISLGPKTMALGAYEVAKEWKDQNHQIDLCYLAREGLVWVFRNQIEPVQVGLADYFRSYGWNVTWKGADDSDKGVEVKLKHLSSVFTQNLSTTARLLKSLRGNDRGKEKRTIHAKRLPADEFALLQQVEATGLVSNVQQNSDQCSWTINSADDGRILLGGDWLEYHFFQVASGTQPRLFDDSGWGVEDSEGKGEVDFAGLYRGQLILASCKTETSLERKWFEELHSKAEQLGKGMCSTLLVTTVSRSERSAKDQADYDKWATERQIVLVMAEDIHRLPAIVRKVVMGDAKMEPTEISCYPRI